MRCPQIKLIAVVTPCIAALAVALAFSGHHQSLSVSLNPSAIEADGSSTALAEVRGRSADLATLNVSSSDLWRLRVEAVERQDGHISVRLRAGVLPGEARVRFTTGKITRQVTVQLTPSTSDYYSDGTPDFLRLDDPSDADSFRRWFAFLAESQFFMQPKFAPEVTDCASLVRFAYREALRDHHTSWAAAQWLPRLPGVPDVRQYQYPHTPLGAALFRTRPGPFVPEDLRGDAFAEFADAKNLRLFNMYLVSRRLSDARSGDVLFFRQDSQRSPFHAMVYLERSSLDGSAEPLAVYHTGPIEGGPGEVRRTTLQQLMHFPDARWRPLPENRAFLGVYRWNILRGSN